MYTVSDLFKQYLALNDREFDVKVVVGNVTYLRDSVIEFEIGDGITASEDFTLGSVIASTLTVSIHTGDIIPNNAKFTPYVRLNGSSGYTEWLPLGDFYIDERKLSNNVWRFSCYDRLFLGQQPYITRVTYPTLMSIIVYDACEQLGVTLDPSVVVETYEVDSFPEGATLRDVISAVAAAHGANAKLGKNGNMMFVKPTHTATKTVLSASSYIRAEQTNPLKTYSKIVAVYDASGNRLVAGNIDAEPDNTLTFYCPFITTIILEKIFTQISGFSYQPFTMDWRGYPQMDVGDVVEVTLRDGKTFSAPIMTNKMSFKGGLKTNSQATSLASNRSEFAFTGSVKQKIQEATKDIAQTIIFFSNEAVVTVGTVSVQPVYLNLISTKPTNVKLSIAIYGVASVANTVTIAIKIDNQAILFTPKQKLQAGDNVIGMPIGITQVQAGSHYVGVSLIVDSGTFTIPINNIQVTIEGGSLLGGTSAELPHAEILQEIIYHDVKANRLVQEQVNVTLGSNQPTSITQPIGYTDMEINTIATNISVVLTEV